MLFNSCLIIFLQNFSFYHLLLQFDQFYNIYNKNRMHICFIIDNSLQLKQKPYTNVSHLDLIKGSIDSMLRDLDRSGMRREHEILHLFVTSNPYEAVSSYQHDQLHFEYQLKNIECNPITYPAETLDMAIKEIGKFRILTETETLLGYREGTIYEPALIIFFTSKLSQRSINKIIEMQYQLRGEYKIVMYRLCLPNKNEPKLIEAIKKEVQSAADHKKLADFLYKMNKSDLKYVYDVGRGRGLVDMLVRGLNSYKPTLCIELKIESEFHNYFSQILVNSETYNKCAIIDDLLKIEIIPQKRRSQIPLPVFHKIKETELNVEIQELRIPRYSIDLTKKLKFQTFDVPCEKYTVVSSSFVSRLEKQLKRHGFNEEAYPVYYSNEKFFFLFAFLHISQNSQPTLITYYPNPNLLSSIVQGIKNRKNAFDNKNCEKMLAGYISSIPYFYLKFLHEYFQYQLGIKIPYDPQLCTYEMSVHRKLFHIREQHRKHIQELGEQNLKNHQEYTAKCCLIYGDLNKYREESRNKSLKSQNESVKNLVFDECLTNVLKLEGEMGIENYLSMGSQKQCLPITRELQKYMFKKEFEGDLVENIMATFGNPYKRKKREVDRFMEDTPMPDVEQETIPTQILEMEKNLFETKLAVEKNIIEKEPTVEIIKKQPNHPSPVVQFISSLPSNSSKKQPVSFTSVNLRTELHQSNMKLLERIKQKLIKE